MTVVILMLNYPADALIVTDSIISPYILPAAHKFVTLLPQKEQEEFFGKEADLQKFWGKNKGKKSSM